MRGHTGFYRAGRNDKTSMGGWDELRCRPLTAHEAFLAAYERLGELARFARRPAALVVAVDQRGRVVDGAVVESGQSLTLGRHEYCGLELPASTVSLRHLVMHARSESRDAAPSIRLWELNTGRPFHTEDGLPHSGVLAQGMLYATLDEYALLFLPTRGLLDLPWPASAEQAWRALPPRRFLDQQPPKPSWVERIGRLRRGGRQYHTTITVSGPLLTLDTAEPPARPERAWAELRLVRGSTVERRLLSLASLEQGVLVGRYERCGITLSESTRISRVHLVLVRVGEQVLAIDTASTNGTWRGDVDVETSVLADTDSLQLASCLTLHWRRLR
jgi:hypothetical protein